MKKIIKPDNKIAKELIINPQYRPKIISSKKNYSRKRRSKDESRKVILA